MGYLEYKYEGSVPLRFTGVPGVTGATEVQPGEGVRYQGDVRMLREIINYMLVWQPEFSLVGGSGDLRDLLEPPPKPALTREEMAAQRRRLTYIEKLMDDSAPDTKGSGKPRKSWWRIKHD